MSTEMELDLGFVYTTGLHFSYGSYKLPCALCEILSAWELAAGPVCLYQRRDLSFASTTCFLCPFHFFYFHDFLNICSPIVWVWALNSSLDRMRVPRLLNQGLVWPHRSNTWCSAKGETVCVFHSFSEGFVSLWNQFTLLLWKYRSLMGRKGDNILYYPGFFWIIVVRVELTLYLALCSE